MFKNTTIQELLSKEMNRKEFLQVMGAAILGIIGISGFLSNLNKFAKTQIKQPKQNVTSGYGSSAYGR